MQHLIALCALVISNAALAEPALSVSRVATRTLETAPAAGSTGQASVDRLFGPDGARRVAGGAVTFAPGARTHWHTHPLGQTLVITSGAGRVQSWGGKVDMVGPGDVVTIPPNVKHWHGAAPDRAMAHIAIQEAQDGKAVTWLEPVSGLEYTGGAPDRAN